MMVEEHDGFQVQPCISALSDLVKEMYDTVEDADVSKYKFGYR